MAPGRVTCVFVLLVIGSLTWPSVPGLTAQAPDEPKPDLWRTQLDVGLNSASGNTSFTTLITGISLKRLETETLELQLSANYRYGKSDGNTIADLFQTQLKLDINPTDVWSPFLFASTERNPVRRVDLRAAGGAGLKFTNWRTERGKTSVSLASIFDYENLKADETTLVEVEKTLRWSARAKVNLYFGDGAEYELVVFHQPVWDDLSDYYFNIDTSLKVPLAAGLSMVARYQFRHDETPAPGVAQDDRFIDLSLRYVF